MDKLKELQNKEINLLKVFLKICKENNIKYYFGGGSLLGAVRHHGFIPWDDDMDIYLKRDDYERFLNIAPKYLNDPNIILNTFDNNSEYFSYQATLVDNSVKVVLNQSKNGIARGAWIDLWPLDGMPKNKILFIIRKYKILYYRYLYQLSVFDDMANIKKKRPLIETILVKFEKTLHFGRLLNPHKRLKKLDKCLKKKQKDEYYLLNGMSIYKFKNMMPENVYGLGEKYDFEGIEVVGPVDYDYFLTKLYGNYMEIPKDKNHHNLSFKEKSD